MAKANANVSTTATISPTARASRGPLASILLAQSTMTKSSSARSFKTIWSTTMDDQSRLTFVRILLHAAFPSTAWASWIRSRWWPTMKADHRFNGYLGFIAARGRDIRALVSGDGTRLFCLYDTATTENEAHADICQNLYLEPGTKNRRKLMMEFAWHLRHAFGLLLSLPPAQSTRQ